MKVFSCFVAPHAISDVVLRADNVLSNSGKELYLPEYVEHLQVMPMLVLRINKVAKAVQPKFANRYYSEVSLALSLRADRLSEGFPERMREDFDGSFIRWSRWASYEEIQDWKVSMAIYRGAELQHRDLPSLAFPPIDELYSTLSIASQYYLIKVGDYVAFPLSERPVGVERGEGIFLIEGADNELIYYKIS